MVLEEDVTDFLDAALDVGGRDTAAVVARTSASDSIAKFRTAFFMNSSCLMRWMVLDERTNTAVHRTNGATFVGGGPMAHRSMCGHVLANSLRAARGDGSRLGRALERKEVQDLGESYKARAGAVNRGPRRLTHLDPREGDFAEVEEEARAPTPAPAWFDIGRRERGA
jgi:hypothetical protein